MKREDKGIEQPDSAALSVRSAIIKHLTELDGVKTEDLLAKRFEKLFRMGLFTTVK